MNILYILQQSIYNNEGKGLSSDSNVNMCIDCVSEMCKIDPTIHFYILISPIHTFADIKSYTELYNKDNVTFVEYPFIVNAFMNRYSFDPQMFIDMYKKLPHIDIVWNNICELTRNIRTTISAIVKDHPLYITANYWLDAPAIGQEKVNTSISYDGRQFDGFECSDICVFTCKSTMRAWEQNAYTKFNKKYIENIFQKSVIWDFGYKISNFSKEKHKKFDIPTILFLNRLSGINYTHHEQFISAVNSLYEKRQDFQVIMTNPSMKVSEKELKNLVKPLKSIDYPISRKDYFTLLQSSHISCHLFTKELYGGCAHREAIEAGLITVTPKVFEYSRIHGDNYPFYVSDDISDLEDILNDALDSISTYSPNIDIIEKNRQSSFEYVTKQVYNDIQEFMKVHNKKH